MMNITSLARGSQGELYFIDQWNENFAADSGYFKNASSLFHIPDRLHAQEVYRLVVAGAQKIHIDAVSNPSFYGDDLLPKLRTVI